MHTLDPRNLLRVWERGVAASPARRGLLLMQLALPQVDGSALMQASIGHRDAWLLNLRETLFGADVACLLLCPACAQCIELAFRVSDIRAPHASPGERCDVRVEGVPMQFRLPTSADLLAIEGETDAAAAELLLLRRCWVARPDAAQADLPSELVPQARIAAAAAMGEIDRQAEVLLDLACPACGHRNTRLFDIVDHLWRELDRWACGLLRKVHALASRYGWSEASVLGMSPARRQAYLDLIEAT